MTLETRLTTLRNGGLLNAENESMVRKVLAYFQEKRGITLDEELGGAFVTHLCACLQRISKGETINEMAPDIFEDIQADPYFNEAWAISLAIQEICPVIPETEVKYLALHTCVILAKR
ncbi:PRD domain-containing protein [Desulfovibrio sp. OttesenSCG-928-G15]|nr:PRD domain-containing protein [Desulfovibrio sp. OttesenSCG-928-G15]